MKLLRKNKNIFVINKKVGQTPLDVLENFKKQNEDYRNKKLTYVGRLDPMAEGKLLVLADEVCKKREKYLILDKEYEFEILLGFKSDSQDILGMVKADFNQEYNLDEIQKKLGDFIGKRKMKYPVFSSKTVKGKPLFLWAKENRLSEIEIPEKEIEIYEIEYLRERILSKKNLEKEIYKKLELVKEGGKNNNDFRKEEILKNWEQVFSVISDGQKFNIIKIKVICSSGTYMRNLSELFAKEIFNSYGLAFSIKRIEIGKYRKFLNFGFWSKKF